MNTTEPVGLGKVRGSADPQVRRPAIIATPSGVVPAIQPRRGVWLGEHDGDTEIPVL